MLDPNTTHTGQEVIELLEAIEARMKVQDVDVTTIDYVMEELSAYRFGLAQSDKRKQQREFYKHYPAYAVPEYVAVLKEAMKLDAENKGAKIELPIMGLNANLIATKWLNHQGEDKRHIVGIRLKEARLDSPLVNIDFGSDLRGMINVHSFECSHPLLVSQLVASVKAMKPGREVCDMYSV